MAGRPKNDPFEGLAEEFKNAVARMGPEEIRKTITAITKSEAENQHMWATDVHVQETKLAYDSASAVYKKKTRENKVAANAAFQKANDVELTTVLLAEQENQKNKDNDAELDSLKETASDAAAVYKEASEMNGTKIKWCLRVLGDKGKA